MPGEEQNDDREQRELNYIRGNRAAWQRLLSLAISELGAQGQTLESLIAEREATVSALRSVCEDFGDNDWPENLHLADVIEKHLACYLDDE